MDENELMAGNDYEANKLASRCTRYAVVAMMVIWLLNQVGLFVLDKVAMTIMSLVIIIILMVPTIITDLCAITGEWVKYINILSIVLAVNAVHAIVDVHAVLLLALPVLIAALYFNPKLIWFTAGANLIGMILGSFLMPYVCIVPDTPFVGYYSILIYALIPRSIIFIAVTLIICVITKRSQKMLLKVFEYSDEISRSVKGLDGVVTQTQKFFVTRNVSRLARIIISAITDVVATQQKRPAIPMGFVGFREEDGTYVKIDQGGAKSVMTVSNDKVLLSRKEPDTAIPIQRANPKDEIKVTDRDIRMAFYQEDNLIALCYIAIKIDTNAEDIRHILDILYVNIKLAIINTRLNDNMFKNQLEIIFAFAEISESKSEQTGKHIKRVAEYMKILGSYYGLSEEECDSLSIASMMHDIGKLLVPSEILEKPGKLTVEEFEVIKQHIKHGYSLLQNSPGRIMSIARNIAYQHHEKWDGTGYMGYKGDQIDFYSRLMAVADVFDALVSKRSYKEKWSIDDAYNEIISQSGKHFDPSVVDAFEACFPQFVEVVEHFPDEE